MCPFLPESTSWPKPIPFSPSSTEVLAALQGGERSPEMTMFLKTLAQQHRDHRAWREQQWSQEVAGRESHQPDPAG